MMKMFRDNALRVTVWFHWFEFDIERVGYINQDMYMIEFLKLQRSKQDDSILTSFRHNFLRSKFI